MKSTFFFIISGLIAVLYTACTFNISTTTKHAAGKSFLWQKELVAIKETSVKPLYYIYLSFDDGPAAGSQYINEIVARDSVGATVFIIGQKVFASDSLSHLFQQYLHNPFIEIGNHSFSHANRHYRDYYKDPALVVSDIGLNADTLDLQNKIVRLPGRNTWRIHGKKRTDLEDANAAADSLALMGYSVIGWDIEWKYIDSSNIAQPATAIMRSVEKIIRKKESMIQGNVVILCHDPMFADSSNRSQLELFIRKAKDDGKYQFEHLSKIY